MTDNLDEKTLKYFKGDHNCSQAVFRTVLEERNAFFDQALSVAAGFGGGILGRGETCGAVTGAVMAIGVLASLKESDMTKQKELAKELGQKFYQLFEDKFGDNTCNGIIGVDKNDPESRQRAIDEGIYQERCPKFVTEAVKIVLALFKEEG